MPLTLIAGDLSVFDVDIEDDGTYADYLGLIQNVTFNGDLDTVDSAPIRRSYSRNQPQKKGGTISAPVMSVLSGSVKVSSLNLDGLDLFGQSYEAFVQSGELNITWNLREATAARDFWKHPQSGGTKELEFSGQILVPSTAALGSQVIPTKFFSATPSDHEGTVSVDINGVAIEGSMTLNRLNWAFNRGDLQVWDIAFSANSPDTGDYPTSPTGTTTILERALNTHTRHRLRLTNHASEGQQIAGLAVLSRATVQIPNSGLITVGYEWQTQGAWTSTPN